MLEVGTILSSTYRVERLLGRGGAACVFLVSNIRLPCLSAVKVITAQYASDQAFAVRFRREAEILATLQHPHVVNVTDWNETSDGCPYLVMEFLRGEDLSELLARRGALPIDEALAIFRQVAGALQAAHDRGIIHRDLKPSNLFVLSDGAFPNFMKVLDFGIAKLLVDAAPRAWVTDHSLLIGTPAYMSPEQSQGNPEIDARSDQFSLAVVLYELLTGRKAFYKPGDSQLAILARVSNEEPAPLFLSPVPRRLVQLEQAVRRAMSKNRQHRFGSISEFAATILDPNLHETIDTAIAVSSPVLPNRETLGLFSLGIGDSAAPRVRWQVPTVAVLLILGAMLLLKGAFQKPRPSAAQRERPLTPPTPTSISPSLPQTTPIPVSPLLPQTVQMPVSTPWVSLAPPNSAKKPHRTLIVVQTDEPDRMGQLAIRSCFYDLLRGLTSAEQKGLIGATFVLDGLPELRIEPHPALPTPYRNSTNGCLARAGAHHPLPARATVRLRAQAAGARP